MRRSSSSLIPILIITLVGGLAFFDEAPRIAPGGAAPVVAAAPLERAPAALDSVAGARASRGAPGGLPLRFEVNRGQTEESVRFVARGAGTVFIRPNEAVVAVASGSARASRRVAVSMRLVGADPAAAVEGEQPLAGRANYLRGRDRSRWIRGVETYGAVRCEEVWPGIGLSYRGCEGKLEYDFIVAPGADPGRIRLAFEGPEHCEIDAAGDLVLHVGGGRIVHRAPVVYQELDRARKEIPGRFVALGDHEFGFAVEAYDPELALIVDPVIEYSTFLGGSAQDVLHAITVDGTGHAYVAGLSESPDFPVTAGAFDTAIGGNSDVVVAKLSPDGSALVWATYIGGSDHDTGYDIAVDDATGRAYVSGSTSSIDFPTTPGAFSETHAGASDGFAFVLSAAGDALVYGTLFGGSESERPDAMALGPQSPPWFYLTGFTYSPDITATPGAFDATHHGSGDVFLAVIEPAGLGAGDWRYFSYLGSGYPGMDWGRDIAVDAGGDAYIVGESTNNKAYPQFPTTPNAYLPFMRIKNSTMFSPFLTRISPDGNGAANLVYSTFFKDPDGGIEQARGVAVDGTGRACVTGLSFQDKWPTTPGAFATTITGHADAFITVIDTNLSGETSLEYSTFIGGSEQDNGEAVAFDAAGAIYVVGTTTQEYPGTGGPIPFPTTPDAFPTTPADYDVFLVKLLPAGNGSADLVFSTLIGGEAGDWGGDLALGGVDDVYLIGNTPSLLFPVTPGAFDTDGDPNGEGFVMHLSLAPAPMPPAAPTNLVATATSSSAIALSWTDQANDEDGFRIERSEDGSSGWAPLVTVGPDVESYEDTGLDPEATWYYRVLAFNAEGDSAWSNVDGATTFGTGGGTWVAQGEIAVAGTVSGSYVDTQAAGGGVEAIQEIESGGKPSNRYTYLEHKWIFALPAGMSHTLVVEGGCTDGGDGDTFVFEVSPDGQNYVPIAGVAITPASGSASGALPGSPSGTVYIRVVDTDRSQGHRATDTVSIDHLYIVSQ